MTVIEFIGIGFSGRYNQINNSGGQILAFLTVFKKKYSKLFAGIGIVPYLMECCNCFIVCNLPALLAISRGVQAAGSRMLYDQNKSGTIVSDCHFFIPNQCSRTRERPVSMCLYLSSMF